MRIVSWNCGSGFHRKIEALLALAPDVAIVQECADLDTLTRKAPEFAPTGALWTGDNPHRGLGVFSFGRYRLARAGIADASITYAIPARVIGPSAFNLVALWSHYGKSPVTVAEPGPTVRALRTYASFLTKRPSIMAGDLNNHVRWDKPGKASNHAIAMAEIAALGLASAYHAFYRLAQGSEKTSHALLARSHPYRSDLPHRLRLRAPNCHRFVATRRRWLVCEVDRHGAERSCAVDRRLLSRIRGSPIGLIGDNGAAAEWFHQRIRHVGVPALSSSSNPDPRRPRA